jgi:hypothetical protein
VKTGWKASPARVRLGAVFVESGRRRVSSIVVTALAAMLPLAARPVAAQEAPIEVNPNRPTFATPALTTQFGVAEVEFGVQQSFLRDESTAFSSPTLLKLGVARDFEVRLSSNGFLAYGYPHAPSVSGFADLALGVQWCYLHDGLFGMDQAIQITHKFATADARKGLGSGVADNTVGLFFSRDIGSNHLDVNVLNTWLGRRPAERGFARQPAAAVSVSHTLSDRWSFGGEVYGIGRSPDSPRVVSNLWYIAYKPSSRLVLDGGVDIGLNRGAQRLSAFAGLTYGIGRFRGASRP